MTARGERLLRLQARITDRDLTLMGWLADHGVLTTDQIAHALYPSLDYAQRRLLKLVEYGLLDRFRPQRPDGGSHPYHYLLAQLGVEVMAAQRGADELPRRDRARRRRWWLTNRANLPHLLAVNQFFTDLAGHARTHPGTALERWWASSRCQQPGAFVYLDGRNDPPPGMRPSPPTGTASGPMPPTLPVRSASRSSSRSTAAPRTCPAWSPSSTPTDAGGRSPDGPGPCCSGSPRRYGSVTSTSVLPATQPGYPSPRPSSRQRLTSPYTTHGCRIPS